MSRYIRMAVLSQRDRSVLARFGAFCASEGVDSSTEMLGDEAFVAAFLTIGCRGLKPHSLGTYRSVLARIAGARYRSVDCFSGCPAPRPYTSKEVAALWSMAQNQSSPLRKERAKVLLATMLGAGLRPGELARASRRDLLSAGTETLIVVRGSPSRALWVHSP